jgi:hypothetical protein
MRRVRGVKYTYRALIQEIRSRGYSVDTIQFPFIADERAVRSSVFERLTGIVDVRGGPDAQAIAVGSTTGPASDPHFARLNWEEFSRDLIVANHFSHVIGVYNLEGCVRQGYLARLQDCQRSVTASIKFAATYSRCAPVISAYIGRDKIREAEFSVTGKSPRR